MLQVHVVRPHELSAPDRAAWAAFQRADAAFASPLLSPEFAEAVAEVRRDAAVTVLRRRGRAVGFLPHHRRPGGFARPIGAPWSDYHGLVTEGLEVDGIEVLRQAGLSAYRFNGLIDPCGAFPDLTGRRTPSYFIAPEQAGEAYWETLRAASPKRFKNMRRLEHKLAREHGETSLVAPDRDGNAFRTLLGWKREQLRRNGMHDILGPAWTQALMAALFNRQEGPLQGLLITLRVGDRMVAGHFGIRIGDRFHPWIAAYDPAFEAYSPGMTFLSAAIRAMPRLGLAHYDLSAGSDHYKKSFASGCVMVREGTARTSRVLDLLPPRGPLLQVQRRLDQIAAAELSLLGRVQGLAAAVVGSPRRLAQLHRED
jgi:CelD/BcsL family acetyltransferase involved in cellulose biosynthesis